MDTQAELVLAYKTTTASEGDSKHLKPLLEKLDDLLPAGHLAGEAEPAGQAALLGTGGRSRRVVSGRTWS